MADPEYCFYFREDWGKCLHFKVAELGKDLEDCDDLRAMGRCPLGRKTNKVRRK